MPCYSYERRTAATSLRENVDSMCWGCVVIRNCAVGLVGRLLLRRQILPTKCETVNSNSAREKEGRVQFDVSNDGETRDLSGGSPLLC